MGVEGKEGDGIGKWNNGQLANLVRIGRIGFNGCDATISMSIGSGFDCDEGDVIQLKTISGWVQGKILLLMLIIQRSTLFKTINLGRTGPHEWGPVNT